MIQSHLLSCSHELPNAAKHPLAPILTLRTILGRASVICIGFRLWDNSWNDGTIQSSDNATSHKKPRHAYRSPSQLNQSLLYYRLRRRNRVLGSRRKSLLLIPAVLRLLLLLLGRLLPRRRGLRWHLDVLGSRVLPVRRLWLLLVLLSRRCLLLRRLLMRWLHVGSWRWRLGPVLGLLGILWQGLLEIWVW